MLKLIKKIIPKSLFVHLQPGYHYLIALGGACYYRFPAQKLTVIAITGTKGKTSVTEILAEILRHSGRPTASSSTLQFKIKDQTQRNLFKMSMPGRAFLQKFLLQAVRQGCHYAIVEMTSEGAKLFRHRFIALDGLIFTNISPEHIEAHGSFQKYLAAKLKIAKALADSNKKEKILVYNEEDKESPKFIEVGGQVKAIPFGLKDLDSFVADERGLQFRFEGEDFNSPLKGQVNLYNLLAAIKMAQGLGLTLPEIKQAIARITVIAGRLEEVKSGHSEQNFSVIVDYAHTADSLQKAYEALGDKRKICVLGSCGGGRDRWKRPEMAKVADNFCDQIILTNEDPYDEDPDSIVAEVATGLSRGYHKIMDRREAINFAIRQVKSRDDVVIITGKGTDPYLMEANGKMTPWSDYEVAREEILKVLTNK